MSSEAHDVCHNATHLDPANSKVPSAIMFSLGILGNVAALVILEIQRCRSARSGGPPRRAVFHVLIKALMITDLVGTCVTSPLVQMSYLRNTTLVGMSPANQSVCLYFGITMTFLTLDTLSLLLIMALERCFAIGYPYLYSRFVTNKCAYITIPLVFLLCFIFCLLPFAGFGKYVQYCPGTWCFIDMNPEGLEDRAYAELYATVLLLLVLAVVACNCFVVYHLFKMYQRRKRNGSVTATTRAKHERRAASMAEEVEYLILLVIMTIIFISCTLPLVIRVFVNSIQHKEKTTKESHISDKNALLYISINSIIDPWVFVLLSPSMLHFCWASVCRGSLQTTRSYVIKSTVIKGNSHADVEASRPTLDYNEEVQSVEKV
ncbi:prostaglandin E receptor 2a (subtype EP2) [Betta splendens]|uniref:Prostaglandin E2 receptor EP2 subtype n=1 Tax=Betta splendens TaxID=158456 RepID=A0A6P7LWD6_BETSP|nr:prostaglandin E receptor 2a (subtype EP2) [Betta splendens]